MFGAVYLCWPIIRNSIIVASVYIRQRSCMLKFDLLANCFMGTLNMIFVHMNSGSCLLNACMFVIYDINKRNLYRSISRQVVSRFVIYCIIILELRKVKLFKLQKVKLCMLKMF